jgi:hypothetical protein
MPLQLANGPGLLGRVSAMVEGVRAKRRAEEIRFLNSIFGERKQNKT